MDASKSADSFRRSVFCVIAVTLAGCGATAPTIQTQTETELAVGAIKAEWLMPCDSIGPPRDNSVGGLLQDYVDVAAAFAVCMQRHNDFVSYMAPLVAKQRGK